MSYTNYYRHLLNEAFGAMEKARWKRQTEPEISQMLLASSSLTETTHVLTKNYFKEYYSKILSEIRFTNNHLIESDNGKKPKNPPGKEGDDWVRPGSDLDPGMETGKTNFPFGWGYPNYKPKYNDEEDFKEATNLNHIADVPYQHSEQDNKKRTVALYHYIQRKMPDFYKKYKSYIDKNFVQHDDYNEIHVWMLRFMDLTKTHPTHANVPDELKGTAVTDEDIQALHHINNMYEKLYSLIHHRDDPQNTLNYPLYVSLYDVTRAFGGYEEGGWFYDKYELISSINIKSPSELIPTAEKLYEAIKIGGNIDGKPSIVVEKERGSQSKAPPIWS
jgi:hypothetical protein